METYEKKYKDAQKWVESIYTELSHERQMEAEAFFPELAESEDERIRKDMIIWLKGFIGEASGVGYTENEIKERIAWLEKQCDAQITDFKEKYNDIAKSDGFNETYEDKSVSEDGLCYAQSILEKTLGTVEGYQTDDGILEHKSAINAVKKLCEQKSVEESKGRLQLC